LSPAKPPSGEGWAHELKHDGYRLQIHVRYGRPCVADAKRIDAAR